MRIASAFVACCPIVLSAATVAFAQSSISFSGTCAKPDLLQTVAANDRPNHLFAVSRGRCSTNDTVGGESGASGVWADQEEIVGDRTKARGVYTETFAGGDKLFYAYRQTVITKDGVFVSGTGVFTIIGGTGKLSALKARGKCTFTPAVGGAVYFSCMSSGT